ncbi:MAG: SsrA-binding protein SmpB [Methylococcales bacterium]|nr:SsrA-binding protein SmpB [Methylococcales bacterium]
MAAKSKSAKHKPQGNAQIAQNRAARHEFFIEDRLEAGLVLEGWEVKSLRAGRAQLKESHVHIKRGEAWLLNAHFSALASASTHIIPEATRPRKLLLHRRELDKLIGAVERKGYTLVALAMYWKKGRAKLELALAKGKKLHDKRAVAKERDWQREKLRLNKHR